MQLVESSPGETDSREKELLNIITHAIGLVLSVLGAVVLMGRGLSQADAWRIAGCGIFAAALIAVYAASTLSHAVTTPRWRRNFRILDQGFIYLLIVGTYTPFALAYLRSTGWMMFFGVMWAIALGGLISKLLFAHRVDAVTIWLYVLLGWMPAIPAIANLQAIPAPVLWWVLAGGLCYTGGTVFLVLDKRHFHFHAIWHLFVIAGSLCHFCAVFRYVASVPGALP